MLFYETVIFKLQIRHFGVISTKFGPSFLLQLPQQIQKMITVMLIHVRSRWASLDIYSLIKLDVFFKSSQKEARCLFRFL